MGLRTSAGAGVAALAVAVLLAGGCGPAEPDGSPTPAAPSGTTAPGASGYDVVSVEQPVPQEWVREEGPRPAVSADLVDRMGDLGVGLWQYLRTQDPASEAWVSPVSVYQALSLLAPGVGPAASGELLSAMGLAAGETRENTAQLADWITAARRSDYRMALYNAAFVAQRYGGFAPGYLEAIEPIRDELGGFDVLDPQGTADSINARVAEHTRGMIEQILTAEDITADLVTILLNATYFKGAWVEPFDPAFTGPGPFTLLDGSTVAVDRMRQFGIRPAVTEGDGYTAAVLPYEGGARAVFVLPDPGSFDEVAAGITAADLARFAAAEAADDDYWVELPTFTSDSGVQELIPALQSLGVSRMFTGTADWPMFDNADRHAIRFVKHRVVVAVNELGTEAAAATAVGGIGGAGPEFRFVVDRPFLMAVLDADDALLFLGQVTDPR